jgi:nuclear pore complex protein Nup205
MDRDTYPLTRAYVRFLTVLLPSDGRPQITGILRRATRYIIETMLLGGNNRAFARAHEELEFYDEVFAFLEKALFSFNITEKLLSTSNSTVGPIAAGLYEEPGFVVILESLNN